jgi:hypothetical protein
MLPEWGRGHDEIARQWVRVTSSLEAMNRHCSSISDVGTFLHPSHIMSSALFRSHQKVFQTLPRGRSANYKISTEKYEVEQRDITHDTSRIQYSSDPKT